MTAAMTQEGPSSLLDSAAGFICRDIREELQNCRVRVYGTVALIEDCQSASLSFRASHTAPGQTLLSYNIMQRILAMFPHAFLHLVLHSSLHLSCSRRVQHTQLHPPKKSNPAANLLVFSIPRRPCFENREEARTEKHFFLLKVFH